MLVDRYRVLWRMDCWSYIMLRQIKMNLQLFSTMQFSTFSDWIHLTLCGFYYRARGKSRVESKARGDKQLRLRLQYCHANCFNFYTFYLCELICVFSKGLDSQLALLSSETISIIPPLRDYALSHPTFTPLPLNRHPPQL